jgi:hypothetical protein
MNDWMIKITLHVSNLISLNTLLDHLKNVSLLAEQVDRLPMVEIVLDDKKYLLMNESDFRERYGE